LRQIVGHHLRVGAVAQHEALRVAGAGQHVQEVEVPGAVHQRLADAAGAGEFPDGVEAGRALLPPSAGPVVRHAFPHVDRAARGGGQQRDREQGRDGRGAARALAAPEPSGETDDRQGLEGQQQQRPGAGGAPGGRHRDAQGEHHGGGDEDEGHAEGQRPGARRGVPRRDPREHSHTAEHQRVPQKSSARLRPSGLRYIARERSAPKVATYCRPVIPRFSREPYQR
jgi:hypothetical protein